MSTLTDVVQRKLRTRGVTGIPCEPIDEAANKVVALPGGLEDIVRVAKSGGGVVYFAEVLFGEGALWADVQDPQTGMYETVDLSHVHELRRFDHRRGSVAFHHLYVPSNGFLVRALSNRAEWYTEFLALRDAAVGQLRAQAV